MSSSARSKTLSVRVSAPEDALDRFEAAWHLASGRKPPAPLALLSFADLPLLMKTLTPARWDLLRRLAQHGPMSVYALAKRLERDYKNVHTDVARLLELDLLEKGRDGRIGVPWQAVRAELRLGA
jgi:predicted transcriptional regulator